MKKCIKFFLPLLLGGFVALVLHFIKIQDVAIFRIDFVMNAIITCVTTLAGFILTSISIIIGMSASPIMQDIRKKGGLSELVMTYSEDLGLSLVMIIVFIFLGANIGEDNVISARWIVICASVLTSYICSMIITVFYLLRIIAKIPSNPIISSDKIPTVPPGEFR